MLFDGHCGLKIADGTAQCTLRAQQTASQNNFKVHARRRYAICSSIASHRNVFLFAHIVWHIYYLWYQFHYQTRVISLFLKKINVMLCIGRRILNQSVVPLRQCLPSGQDSYVVHMLAARCWAYGFQSCRTLVMVGWLAYSECKCEKPSDNLFKWFTLSCGWQACEQVFGERARWQLLAPLRQPIYILQIHEIVGLAYVCKTFTRMLEKYAKTYIVPTTTECNDFSLYMQKILTVRICFFWACDKMLVNLCSEITNEC